MDARSLYYEWVRNRFLTQEQRDYLQSIAMDDEKIEEIFTQDITFGTAGLRGELGIGPGKMNNFQIARVGQAFSNYLIKSSGGEVGNGVAIAFDTRETSEMFTDTAVRMLLGNGISTALFMGPKSVAQLSFAIRYLKLEGGVMITASHNSKEYNGYKIFDSTGTQMRPDQIQSIIDDFNNIKSTFQVHAYVGVPRINSIHHKIGIVNDTKYRKAVMQAQVCADADKSIKIAYSPLHGNGIYTIPELFKNDLGYKSFYSVKEQMKPDGTFPTVAAPNPEDPEAMAMVLELAAEKDADIALATDCDCDRVGVGVKDGNGGYRLLSGNEEGALLLDYIVRYKKDMPENPIMIQTIVTSGFAKAIAEKAGVRVAETLTGFKYIGEYMNKLEEAGDNGFILGYEESFGSLVGDHARDKDAAGTCMLFAEMAGVYKAEGTSIYERLNALYAEYGYYDNSVKSMVYNEAGGKEKMAELVEKLRGSSLAEIAGEAVAAVDYLNDETGLPKENVMKYSFADGSFVAVRPSGTEPKLKIYYSVKGADEAAAAERKQKIAAEIEAIFA